MNAITATTLAGSSPVQFHLSIHPLLLLAIVVLGSVELVYRLWLHFVAVMRLRDVRDAGQLTTAAKVFGYRALLDGLILDFIVNVIIGTVIFLDWPREFTLSGRLTRLSETGRGYRKPWATKIRMAYLDNIDSRGVHRG